MFHNILVAIDGSPAGEKALSAAVDLAVHYNAQLTGIGVLEVPEVVAMINEVDELRQAGESHFRQIGEAAVAFAASRGVRLPWVVVRSHAADAIVRHAEADRANLVVMGEHGHSRIGRFFLGSTSDRVSEHAPSSVMIVR